MGTAGGKNTDKDPHHAGEEEEEEEIAMLTAPEDSGAVGIV